MLQRYKKNIIYRNNQQGSENMECRKTFLWILSSLQQPRIVEGNTKKVIVRPKQFPITY